MTYYACSFPLATCFVAYAAASLTVFHNIAAFLNFILLYGPVGVLTTKLRCPTAPVGIPVLLHSSDKIHLVVL